MDRLEEPLRDQIGRALYEEPRLGFDWYRLNEERREPWRKDADRVIDLLSRREKVRENHLSDSLASHGLELRTDPCGLLSVGIKERLCQKCGAPTRNEEAYVDGQYWCHPCADS